MQTELKKKKLWRTREFLFSWFLFSSISEFLLWDHIFESEIQYRYSKIYTNYWKSHVECDTRIIVTDCDKITLNLVLWFRFYFILHLTTRWYTPYLDHPFCLIVCDTQFFFVFIFRFNFVLFFSDEKFRTPSQVSNMCYESNKTTFWHLLLRLFSYITSYRLIVSPRSISFDWITLITKLIFFNKE